MSNNIRIKALNATYAFSMFGIAVCWLLILPYIIQHVVLIDTFHYFLNKSSRFLATTYVVLKFQFDQKFCGFGWLSVLPKSLQHLRKPLMFVWWEIVNFPDMLQADTYKMVKIHDVKKLIDLDIIFKTLIWNSSTYTN